MAPPFTLKLGSLDLAPYIRIGNDEGFDPYDGGGFEEPAFTDNPFGEGQGLANVDSRNREMSWPLYLNASTKDGLHTLVRQINQEIRYAARPLRVEWRDQDATASTFYDVEFARFDPNFRMRPSAQKWLAGVLRVWTKPYGHTATARYVATMSAAVGTMPLASLAGDMGALMKVAYSTPSMTVQVGSGAPPMMTVIDLSAPGIRNFRGASLIAPITAGGTIVHDSTALASTYLRGVNGLQASSILDTSTVPTSGRMMALARRTGTGMFSLQVQSLVSGKVGTNVVAVATQDFPLADAWRLLDLGPYRFDREITPTIGLMLTIGSASNAATVGVCLNGLMLVSDNAVVVRETDPHPFVNPTFVGPNSTAPGSSDPAAASYTLSASDDRYVRMSSAGGAGESFGTPDREISGLLVGVVPQPLPGASQALFFACLRTGAKGGVNVPVSVEVAVRERFTFAR